MMKAPEFWHIWYEIFDNGKLVKTGQYHRSYRSRSGASRKAHELYDDVPHLRWAVSETCPWETKGERPMANAKKCDRCGKYYDKNELHSTDTNYGRSRIDGMAFTTTNGECCKDHDLCDNCITLLKEWLKGEK